MQNAWQVIKDDLDKIQQSRPLIHNISNFVAMSFTANALLAIGASPLMAHAAEDIEEIVKHSHALLINIGTIDQPWFNTMHHAVQIAAKHQCPIILDPVGAGATSFRTESCLALLEAARPAVIRGNAAEIMSLSGIQTVRSKGVDSLESSEAAYEAGKQLAHQYRCTVVISGAEDFIISEQHAYKISNGCTMMGRVTAMGCTATALTAAFCAINKNFCQAATSAMAVMGLSGEVAMQQAEGPGSFQMHFLDALFNLHQTENLPLLKLFPL